MSKNYYLKNKSLHGLPMFRSKAKVNHVGNCASVDVLFISPIIVPIQGHMFQIYIIFVSEIQDDVYLVLDVKTSLN